MSNTSRHVFSSLKLKRRILPYKLVDISNEIQSDNRIDADPIGIRLDFIEFLLNQRNLVRILAKEGYSDS